TSGQHDLDRFVNRGVFGEADRLGGRQDRDGVGGQGAARLAEDFGAVELVVDRGGVLVLELNSHYYPPRPDPNASTRARQRRGRRAVRSVPRRESAPRSLP